MGHEVWALGKTFDSSKGFSQSEDFKSLQKFGNLFFSSFNSEWKHSSKTSHLLFSDFMLWVRFKAWVNDWFNQLMFLHVVGKVIPIMSRFEDSNWESLDTSVH